MIKQLFILSLCFLGKNLSADDKAGFSPTPEMYLYSFLSFSSFTGLIFLITGLLKKDIPGVKSPPQQKAGKKEKFSVTVSDGIRLPKSETLPRDESELCKQFLENLNSGYQFRSVGIYFLKERRFLSFFESAGKLMIRTENKEDPGINSEVLDKLSNKTGVYNSDHTAAYLPLVSGDLLFGFLKISFQTETHNFEFSGLWKEIQKFSDHLTEFRNYYLAIHNPTTGIFNYYHFLGTLRSKSNESRTGNITLIKIGLTGDAGIAIEKLSAGLLSLFGEDFPVYQISDDTLGFFPDAVQLEKLQNSLGEIFSQMSSYSSRIKMWVGSADMNTSYHSAEKWLSKAHNALSQAIDAGPNNFKLFANK